MRLDCWQNIMVLVGFLSGPVAAHAVPPDASGYDVSGVKLGMSREAALSALQAANPGYAIRDNTAFPDKQISPAQILGENFQASAYAIVADSPDLTPAAMVKDQVAAAVKVCIAEQLAKFGPVWQKANWPPGMIEGQKFNIRSDCRYNGNKYVNDHLAELVKAPREIIVWLSPASKTVIAVESAQTFFDPVPSVDGVVKAVEDKYQLSDKQFVRDQNGVTDFLEAHFDNQNHPIAADHHRVGLTDPSGLLSDCRIDMDQVSSLDNSEPNIRDLDCPTLGVPSIASIGGHIVLSVRIEKNPFIVNGKGNLIAQGPRDPKLAHGLTLMLYDQQGIYSYRAEAAKAQAGSDITGAAEKAAVGVVPKL